MNHITRATPCSLQRFTPSPAPGKKNPGYLGSPKSIQVLPTSSSLTALHTIYSPQIHKPAQQRVVDRCLAAHGTGACTCAAVGYPVPSRLHPTRYATQPAAPHVHPSSPKPVCRAGCTNCAAVACCPCGCCLAVHQQYAHAVHQHINPSKAKRPAARYFTLWLSLCLPMR